MNNFFVNQRQNNIFSIVTVQLDDILTYKIVVPDGSTYNLDK